MAELEAHDVETEVEEHELDRELSEQEEREAADTLAAAIAGGVLGERYYRQVDLAGGVGPEQGTVTWRWPRR